jgi:hypothetical protein
VSKLRSNTSLELEIQALLSHHQTADLAADALIKKYETQNLSLGELETLMAFLMHCGFYSSIVDLSLKKLKAEQKISWAYFAEALFRSQAPVSDEIKKLVLETAKEQAGLMDICRSHFLDDVEPDLVSHRNLRRQSFVDRHLKLRQELLQEADLLKSQGLLEQEDKALLKLSFFFPGDHEIEQRRNSLRERLAGDIIAKKQNAKAREKLRDRSPLFIPYHEPMAPETRELLDQIFQSMLEKINSLEDGQFLAEDFAVALLTWENENAALKILEFAPPTISSDWLKAEILLSGRLFVELLNHLTWLEATYGADPECLFSVSYLRAQALWGLNQKAKAIEILQGMLITRPQYRAAHSLLNQWKEDLYE